MWPPERLPEPQRPRFPWPVVLLLLTAAVLGAAGGWVVSAWHNENCPDLPYYLGRCTRLKPVHAGVIGIVIALALGCVVYAIARALGAGTRAGSDLTRRGPR